jgi:MtN3 and saliva related transmembrane protein
MNVFIAKTFSSSMNWITLLGLAAAACTTISFLPQAIKTIKTKDTRSLSLGMYAILVIGIALWAIYGIIIKDWPLIIANVITVIFSGIILAFKIRYG